jgi:hypothetical protein
MQAAWMGVSELTGSSYHFLTVILQFNKIELRSIVITNKCVAASDHHGEQNSG